MASNVGSFDLDFEAVAVVVAEDVVYPLLLDK
jgi:hypothetical protein